MTGSWRRAPLLLTATLPLCLPGCTTTVFPPDQVAEPAQVGILDHGRHATLILEVPEGGMLLYGYGDWTWYALRQTGAVEGSSAVLWPTQAALGRRRLPGPFSPEAVSRAVEVPIEDALYLTVEAAEVRRLVDRLERIFRENIASRVYNPSYDLEFVHHPEPYWILHNSNQVVADWLRELGCRVEGPAVLSDWRRGTPAGAR